VILIADTEPSLALIRREVSQRYGRDYRVLAEPTAADGLARLAELAAASEEVALIMTDQWLADSTGVDFLVAAHRLHRTARRALLIAWGDRSTARPILQAAARGDIDYYLPKPVYAPDERFHRTVTEFLDEWWRLRGQWFEVFRIVGEERSARSHEIRDILHRNGLPYGFYPAGSADGQAILAEAGAVDAALPVLVLYDGRVLANPTNSEVAQALGVNVETGDAVFDLAIVGAGPSGLAAAVYGASEGLSVAMVEPEAMGGQAGTSSLIRNYPGFPRGISGAELAFRAYDQAWLFGAELVYGHPATGLDTGGDVRVVTLADGSQLRARAVILSCGVSYRRLGVPALESLLGAGVVYGAAVTQAQAYAGEPVFVVGGGNSAGQAAMHLARFASSVTILVRSGSLAQSMSEYLVNEIDAAPIVGVRYHTEVLDGGGESRLEWLDLRDRRTGEVERVPAAAIFVLIGAQPFTDWLPGSVARDQWGYVLTGDALSTAGAAWPQARTPLPFETSLPGVFAIGDVRHGSVKRVASAVGEGSVAITSVHEYLAMIL
jgi:thioredoxin reductase (NADPH)